MAQVDNRTQLSVSIDAITNDLIAVGGAILMVIGSVGSVYCFSAYWLYRFSYATEIMAGLSVIFYLGYVIRTRPWTLTIDREFKTLTWTSGPFACTDSYSSIEGIVLYCENRTSRGITRPVYHVVINGIPNVFLGSLEALLPARELGRVVSRFLEVQFDDQTIELTRDLRPRDIHERFGKGRRTLSQLAPSPVQFSLKSVVILMFSASILVGIAVKLHATNSPWVPLIGPAGVAFLVILGHLLNRRR